MTETQLPFLVEGILILVCAALGLLLKKGGSPYSRWKLILHIFFFLWLSTGFGFIFYGYTSMAEKMFILIPVSAMGVLLLGQLTTGIMMLTSQPKINIPRIHLATTVLLLLCDGTAFFLA